MKNPWSNSQKKAVSSKRSSTEQEFQRQVQIDNEKRQRFQKTFQPPPLLSNTKICVICLDDFPYSQVKQHIVCKTTLCVPCLKKCVEMHTEESLVATERSLLNCPECHECECARDKHSETCVRLHAETDFVRLNVFGNISSNFTLENDDLQVEQREESNRIDFQNHNWLSHDPIKNIPLDEAMKLVRNKMPLEISKEYPTKKGTKTKRRRMPKV